MPQLVNYQDLFTNNNASAVILITDTLYKGEKQYTALLFKHSYPLKVDVLSSVPFLSKFYLESLVEEAHTQLLQTMPSHYKYTVVVYGPHAEKLLSNKFNNGPLKFAPSSHISYPAYLKLIKKFATTLLMPYFIDDMKGLIHRFNKTLKYHGFGTPVTRNSLTVVLAIKQHILNVIRLAKEHLNSVKERKAAISARDRKRQLKQAQRKPIK